MTFRILVTGSRDWEDERRIFDKLRDVTSGVASQDVTIVHGACRSGADQHADRYALIHGANVERHPANWGAHGSAAGTIRNRHMVGLGADICLAFIRHNSRGATGCVDMAEAAGILTRRFTA